MTGEYGDYDFFEPLGNEGMYRFFEAVSVSWFNETMNMSVNELSFFHYRMIELDLNTIKGVTQQKVDKRKSTV